jgi:ABC-type Zn2+ transport system substrate-binding protein/surface adhesin
VTKRHQVTTVAIFLDTPVAPAATATNTNTTTTIAVAVAAEDDEDDEEEEEEDDDDENNHDKRHDGGDGEATSRCSVRLKPPSIAPRG